MQHGQKDKKEDLLCYMDYYHCNHKYFEIRYILA